MDVDDAYTKVVGESGRYQILLFSVMNLFAVFTPAINLAVVFVAGEPEELKYNPRADKHSTILVEWDLLEKRWISNAIQSLFYGGFLVGVIVFGQLSDRFGRQKVFLAGAHIFFPVCILTAFSWSWEVFAVCRFFTGLLYGGTGLVLFVYLQEIFGRSKWAITGTITGSMFAFGIAYLVTFAYFIPNWRHMVIWMSLPQLIVLIAVWFLPESPRWLYAKGRLKEAEAVLIKIARKNGVRNPVLALVRKPEEKEKANFNLIDLIKHRVTRKRILIMAYLWFVNSFVYYALTLAAGDIGSNLYLSELLSGLVELPPQIWCLFLLNWKWFGRNRTLYSALLISGASCMALMSFKHTESSWGKMALGLVGKMMISSSFNTLYVYSPELFPTSVRNVALGSSSMCARVGSMVATFATSMIASNAKLSYAMFGIFALTAGFLAMLLPETIGLKPPDSFNDLGETIALQTLTTAGTTKDKAPLLANEETEEDEIAL